MTLRELQRLQRITRGYGHAESATISTLEGRQRRPREAKRYEFHPLAKAIPRHTLRELRMMATDIDRIGVEEPVVMYDGMILDGRARAYLADRLSTTEHEIVVPVQTLNGDGDPRRLLVEHNLHRRSLTDEQIAMVEKRQLH